MNRSILLLTLLTLIQTVSAHTYIKYINKQEKCLRGIRPDNEIDSPIVDPTSKQMECNLWGDKPAQESCGFKAGVEITLEWVHEPEGDIIDPSHKGPCSVYISQAGTGKWAKIYEDGFKNGQWCIDRLRANAGKMTFNLPKEMANGKWIIRGEIIALHAGDRLFKPNVESGAQYYMRCMDIDVTGGGGQQPSTTVSIPGYLKADDPGVYYNLYDGADFNKYPIPGPKLTGWGGSSSGDQSTSNEQTQQQEQTPSKESVDQPEYEENEQKESNNEDQGGDNVEKNENNQDSGNHSQCEESGCDEDEQDDYVEDKNCDELSSEEEIEAATDEEQECDDEENAVIQEVGEEAKEEIYNQATEESRHEECGDQKESTADCKHEDTQKKEDAQSETHLEKRWKESRIKAKLFLSL